MTFVILYPMLKDITQGILNSEGSSIVVAIALALMAFGGIVFIVLFYMITAFISVLIVLISIFSGFELIHWTNIHKINLMLFFFH